MTGWHPNPTSVRDRGLVRAPRLEHRHLVVDQLVGVPPEDRAAVVAVRRPLAAIDGQVDVGLAPDDPGGLEPLRGEAAGGDDLVVQHAGERLDRRRDLVVDVAVHGAVRHTARRRQVRVAQVQEDPRGVGAGRRRDAVEQRLDLRVDDPHDVDAAQHDARVASLEDEGPHLERQAVATRVPRLPDEPDHRQPERGLEAGGRRLRRETRSWSALLAVGAGEGVEQLGERPATRSRRTARPRPARRLRDRRARRSLPCRAGGRGRSHG